MLLWCEEAVNVEPISGGFLSTCDVLIGVNIHMTLPFSSVSKEYQEGFFLPLVA